MDRQDHIQGLRALAVILVLVFHAFPQTLPGGFVGVDLFFVISGYLITRNSLSSIQDGSFSWPDFLLRRLMRLLPALLPVLWFVLILGWFFALPSEYASWGSYVRSGALFTSNWLSLSEAGYFDAEAFSKPLLHLWSLGVEMTFYVVACLVFAILVRYGGRSRPALLLRILLLLAIVSFVFGLWLTFESPQTAYFSPLSRGWEFLAGAIIALIDGNWFDKQAGRLPPWLGLTLFSGLISAALGFSADKAIGFPGWVATYPVAAGLAALALPTSSNPLRYVLSTKWLVWVGNISYPLYLWHWPLITLGWIYLSAQPPLWYRWSAVILSFVLAWFTYRFIERPVNRLKYQSRWVTPVFLSLTALTAYLGHNIHVRGGLEFRSGPTIDAKIAGELDAPAYFANVRQRFVACEDTRLNLATDKFEGQSRCFQSRSGAVTVLLLGDSHAEHLLPGFASRLPHEVVALALGSGAPVRQNAKFTAYFDLAANSGSIHTVVISALWLDRMTQMPPNAPDFYTAFGDSVRALIHAGKHVIVLGDVPAFSFHPKRCKYARPGQEGLCEERMDQKVDEIIQSESPLAQLAQQSPSISFWSPLPCFCQGRECRMTRDTELLFRDKNHLTFKGSEHLVSCLMQSGMSIRGSRVP